MRRESRTIQLVLPPSRNGENPYAGIRTKVVIDLLEVAHGRFLFRRKDTKEDDAAAISFQSPGVSCGVRDGEVGSIDLRRIQVRLRRGLNRLTVFVASKDRGSPAQQHPSSHLFPQGPGVAGERLRGEVVFPSGSTVPTLRTKTAAAKPTAARPSFRTRGRVLACAAIRASVSRRCRTARTRGSTLFKDSTSRLHSAQDSRCV